MRERQPLAQLTPGFVGRLTVEGHERRRHASQSPNLGTPSILHECDFDLIGTSTDDLFKVMNGHVDVSEMGETNG